jgi:hypothetical protein
MKRMPMTDVAVVIREDTGIVQSKDGQGLADIAHVLCDSCKTVRPIPNIYIGGYGTGPFTRFTKEFGELVKDEFSLSEYMAAQSKQS